MAGIVALVTAIFSGLATIGGGVAPPWGQTWETRAAP